MIGFEPVGFDSIRFESIFKWEGGENSGDNKIGKIEEEGVIKNDDDDGVKMNE